MLKGLNTIAKKTANPTELTRKWTGHMLDYASTNPEATIRYYASNMILKIHSDASYLDEANAKSSYGGYFFLGWTQNDSDPLRLNGCVQATSNTLKLVATSASEAELGGTFNNAQMGTIMRLTLSEMGWPQPATVIYVDNSTVYGIANSTIKQQRSRAMNKNFFWIIDQVDLKNFRVVWAPGLENLADYFTKHHTAKHHLKVRPYYLHMDNSPKYLAKAPSPSRLRGCVESVFHGYTKQSPLATIAECTIPNSSTYLRAITQSMDRLTNTYSTANQSLAHIIMAG